MSEISVIIPIYNGERHIESCYNSLCAQTFQKWFAIFINDGSSDKTSIFLNELASKDNRIKVIHKQNEGVAIARDVGVRHAETGIVTFLDVDDTLCHNALECFVKAFDDDDEIDIVISGINIVSEKMELLRQLTYIQDTIPSKYAVDKICDGRIRWQLWAKAFRKKTIDHIIVPKGIRNAEDMAVCLQAMVAANKVKILSKCLYNYVQVATSVTHIRPQGISEDALEAVRFVDRAIGDRIGKNNLDCLSLLIVSGVLHGGIDLPNKEVKDILSNHFSINSLRRLNPIKAINILLFKLFGINLARYI